MISEIYTETPGKYFFTIVAAAPDKDGVEANFMVDIKKYSIDYKAVALPRFKLGDDVDVNLATGVSNANAKVTYSLKSGSVLPKGLSLSTVGRLYGSAEKAYTDYEFVVVANAMNSQPTEVIYSYTSTDWCLMIIPSRIYCSIRIISSN